MTPMLRGLFLLSQLGNVSDQIHAESVGGLDQVALDHALSAVPGGQLGGDLQGPRVVPLSSAV
jgi:hypothetical protein